MSPSWISRFSIKPEVTAGIAIGRNQVCAVVLEEKAGQHAIRAIRTRDLAAPIFNAQHGVDTESKLADALQAVSQEFKGLFAAVHIALPDTVIRSSVFELDELPKQEAMRKTLLSWRFSKEWRRTEDSLDCRGFDLGEEQGKRLYFGQAGDRPWLDCVRRSLVRAGITPWSMNAAAVYRFNCFQDLIANGAGALLSLDPDCWNLLIWDDAGRVRQVLTRLRGSTQTEDEALAIANEAERAMLAYAQGNDRSTVNNFYLAGAEAEMAALAEVLDARLPQQTRQLRLDKHVSGTLANINSGLAPLALAAGLNI